MKTLAIIAEYNPFHNGHLYQLSEAKEITKADYVIVAMSGNFVQRGEPAIIDKWARTEMALNAGADLIIEIPFVFSTQDANGFAFGGIKLLDSLNIVDYLCFGCENSERNILFPISDFLTNEPPEFINLLKENSKKGFEYPRSRSKALCEYHKIFGINNLKNISSSKLQKILLSPNNILAFEYIKHLLNLNSDIQPIPIKRILADYHEKIINGNISSATSIRNEIFNNLKYSSLLSQNINSKVKSTIPYSAYQTLTKELKEGRAPISLNSYEQHIIATLRSMPTENISYIQGVNEGLENRIKKAALKSTNIDILLKSIKTRRYTLTKIKRIILHVVMGLLKEDTMVFNNSGPLYIRLLGFSKKGKILLNLIKKKSSLPIITKLSAFTKSAYSSDKDISDLSLRMIHYDILSTDLYSLGYKKESKRIARTDFTNKIIKKND